MRQRVARCGPVLAAAVAALLVAGCSGGATQVPPSAAPATGTGQPGAGQTGAGQPGSEQVVDLTFAQGAVQGGVSRTPVQLGRKVRLVVHSDVADEIHVHGYDLKAQVPAGGVGTVEFVADQSGVFEVELESRGAQLAQLEVR